jgi:hypothetical protein
VEKAARLDLFPSYSHCSGLRPIVLRFLNRPAETGDTQGSLMGMLKRMRALARELGRRASLAAYLGMAVLIWWLGSSLGLAAEPKGDKSFHAVVTDAQGVETELKNLTFYWEEKMTETSFVPHELRHLPAKRGTATVNIKFEQIKQIDVKGGGEKGLPAMTVTLTNGKNGEFTTAVHGSFRGESDFGQMEVPVETVSKVVFK